VGRGAEGGREERVLPERLVVCEWVEVPVCWVKRGWRMGWVVSMGEEGREGEGEEVVESGQLESEVLLDE